MNPGKRHRQLLCVSVVGLLSVICGPAHAYTISTQISNGCHEAIAAEGLRTVRGELPTAGPLPLTDDEQAFVDDLPFKSDNDMKDLGAATFLVSIRDNDLKGRAADDLSALTEIHGNPDNQGEHCLRSLDQNEPGGSAAAVTTCRAFIRQRVTEALAALDATGTPDIANRTPLTVHLSLRGGIDVPLPTYYVRMAQAIHALQDSFTHTYRSPDGMKITVVLNWIDKVNGDFVESRDGPAHASALDVCEDLDALRERRWQLAIEASAGVLRATLDPMLTPDQKLATVDGVLDTYMSYMPGCTFDNNWCDAPEAQYKDAQCGCTVGRSVGHPRATLVGLTLALLGVFRRRARRRAVGSAIVIAAAISMAPSAARAESDAPKKTQSVFPADNTGQQSQEPGPRDPGAQAWGGYFAMSASADKPALAGTLGGRFRFNKRWTFGVDAEWNPWLAFNGTTFRSGVFNAYGTAIFRYPLAHANFNLRSTANLGMSYLLMSLYGAPAGGFGVYTGVSFLALESKVFRTFYLIIDPINIALPIPQTHGVPLIYHQYRFTVGIEIYSG